MWIRFRMGIRVKTVDQSKNVNQSPVEWRLGSECGSESTLWIKVQKVVRVQNVDQIPECESESRMWIMEQKEDHRTIDGSESRCGLGPECSSGSRMWIRVQNVDQRTECGSKSRMWIRVHAVMQLLFFHHTSVMISS
jgi:hypothetical protein